MSDNNNLRQQLLKFFQINYNTDVKLIDICRAVQQPKKAVNSVLYSLRNEGVLQKVVESPPVWRVNEMFNQPPGPVRVVPIPFSVQRPDPANNNSAAILPPPPETTMPDTIHVREELIYANGFIPHTDYDKSHDLLSTIKYSCSSQSTVAYPVMNGVATVEDARHAFNGRITAHPTPLQLDLAGGAMQNAFTPPKPAAESIVNILSKQKGPMSCKAISSLSGLPEATVKLTLNHLLFLGLVFQDSYDMYWGNVNRNNTQPQDLVVTILNYLKKAQTPVHTKELVRGVGLNNKKEINPLLYKLQQKGVVTKVNESPPMWQLAEQVANNVNDDVKRDGEQGHQHENVFHGSNPLTAYAAGDFRPIVPITAPCLNNHMLQTPPRCVQLKQPMVYEQETAPQMEPPEETPLEYTPQRKSNSNYANQEKNKGRCEELGDLDKANATISNQELCAMMKSLHASNTAKNESKSNKNIPTSQGPNPPEGDSPPNNGRNGQNSKQSSDGSAPTSRGSRKAANAAKAASKSPEQSSAAHYVNDVLNSDSFAALMKNPVSALYEYGQRNHIDTKVEITLAEGPPHNPRFKAVAYMGEDELAAAWDKTKKDARRQAAELAVRGLVANGGFGKFSSLSANTETINELQPAVSNFDLTAALCHKTFNERVLQVPEYMGGRKVLAALVMKIASDDARGTVICLGTGNRCITGEGLSQDGLVVNDSHAEVITRRGFLRFLYKQLEDYNPDEDHEVFIPSDDARYKLEVRKEVSFHLYISTAPCGDGALFTHNLKPGEKVEPPDNTDTVHHPVFTKSLQGLLRSKMEAGEGTIPIDTQYRFQSWDAILRGEKLRTMSCSDKIARWNVLGLQGALLSHILKPIYLKSVTLGNLYHHGHLSRAVCCRLVGEPKLDDLLPEPYRLNHPDLGRVNVFTPSRETEKTKPHSINWCLEDEHPELTSGVNGTSDERAGGQIQSRLCKAAIFKSFKSISLKFGLDQLSSLTYGEAKREAKDFQSAKEVMFSRFQQLGRGTWIRKPEEEEEFV